MKAISAHIPKCSTTYMARWVSNYEIVSITFCDQVLKQFCFYLMLTRISESTLLKITEADSYFISQADQLGYCTCCAENEILLFRYTDFKQLSCFEIIKLWFLICMEILPFFVPLFCQNAILTILNVDAIILLN